MKLLEKNLNTLKDIENYNLLKNHLENLYKHITKRTKIRNRYQRYEDGERSTKFFLNLRKGKATKSTIKILENNDKKIID